MDRIICIAGPTASGKTALAVSLARELDGEVISCDSMQIYKYMDIGTAKPTEEEKCGVPHHMLDVVMPNEDYSVSRYCKAATAVAEDILSRGKVAIVAGGTGLYMDNLIKGTEFAPFPSTGRRQKLEAIAAKEGIEKVIEMLRNVDPEAASRLHRSDEKRIIRAMEVYLETGETITEHDRRTKNIPPKFRPLWLGICDEARSDLYYRIDSRVTTMIKDGLIEEIRHLLAMGIPEKCTAMQAIGYKEFLGYLHGQCSLEEAAAQVQIGTRHYAKRQLTWFRRNPEMHWLVRSPDGPDILSQARHLWEDFDK